MARCRSRWRWRSRTSATRCATSSSTPSRIATSIPAPSNASGPTCSIPAASTCSCSGCTAAPTEAGVCACALGLGLASAIRAIACVPREIDPDRGDDQVIERTAHPEHQVVGADLDQLGRDLIAATAVAQQLLGADRYPAREGVGAILGIAHGDAHL